MITWASGCSSFLVWSRLGILGTILGVALLAGIVTSSRGQETTVGRGTPSSEKTFLQRIVRSSQAITDVRVGEGKKNKGRRIRGHSTLLDKVGRPLLIFRCRRLEDRFEGES